MKTTVVNIKTWKDGRAVYIGRGGYWGNPFKVGRDGTREEVIEKFREYGEEKGLKTEAYKLRGKYLGCFCKPLACHGDVLAEWADEDVL